MKKQKWIEIYKNVDCEKIGKENNISPVLARIITNRNITDINTYLMGTSMYDPFLMKDMEKAVDIILNHQTEKIRIIADYDIDGVNSGYILLKGFLDFGINNIDVVIPDRIKDGYGINENLIKQAINDGVKMIITCDNGISAIDAINYAKQQNLIVIVTDHHEVPYTEENGIRVYKKSEADAIINPHQIECQYPFKGLCGAAVAWKLMLALYMKANKPYQNIYRMIENVAFATIGDVMDLIDENRIITKIGLAWLNQTENIGLRALINECELKEIKAYHIGFVIGPCINAAGRLETAQEALDLLCETDKEKAEKKAKELVALNKERQELTKEGTQRAIGKVNENDKVIVVYLENCHESIAGIIAGRLREKYHKPSFVLVETSKCAKGSGRSIEEYSMFEEMNKIADVFLGFGGHPMAAGLSIEKNRVDEFRRRINENCPDIDFSEKIKIDYVMPLEYVQENIIEELKLLEPIGKGNPKAVFAENNIKIISIKILGKNKNVLKLNLRSKYGRYIDGMVFSEVTDFLLYMQNKFGKEEVEKAMSGLENNLYLTATYDMSINEFRGNKTEQIIIKNYQ